VTAVHEHVCEQDSVNGVCNVCNCLCTLAILVYYTQTAKPLPCRRAWQQQLTLLVTAKQLACSRAP
jgi:hypothetical protein